MRTEFFKESALSEKAKESFMALASLNVESAKTMLDWFQDKSSYPRFDENDIRALAEVTEESGETIIHSLGILKTLIDQLILHNDTVDDVYQDIKELGIVSNDIGYSTLDVVFGILPDIVKKYRLLKRCSITERAGAQNLVSSSMTASLKPVYLRSYKYGDDSLSDYEPAPVTHVVVAQIELFIDGKSDSTAFQVNIDELDRFLTDLLVLQKNMEQLKTFSSSSVSTKSKDA